MQRVGNTEPLQWASSQYAVGLVNRLSFNVSLKNRIGAFEHLLYNGVQCSKY